MHFFFFNWNNYVSEIVHAMITISFLLGFYVIIKKKCVCEKNLFNKVVIKNKYIREKKYIWSDRISIVLIKSVEAKRDTCRGTVTGEKYQTQAILIN